MTAKSPDVGETGSILAFGEVAETMAARHQVEQLRRHGTTSKFAC
jgi:hypothetical protein